MDSYKVCTTQVLRSAFQSKFKLGRKLPPNLKFIAAANPYRQKKLPKEDDAASNTPGLAFDQYHSLASIEQQTTNKDIMHRLVYRVHPIPESLLDYVWDYGYLQPEV